MLIFYSNTISYNFFRGDQQVVPRLQALRPADTPIPVSAISTRATAFHNLAQNSFYPTWLRQSHAPNGLSDRMRDIGDIWAIEHGRYTSSPSENQRLHAYPLRVILGILLLRKIRHQ